ncbi:hypothetical protein OH492_27230 [Vibrio chagasii]|nr:hypothetical protein [Vibrio chagasii]
MVKVGVSIKLTERGSYRDESKYEFGVWVANLCDVFSQFSSSSPLL